MKDLYTDVEKKNSTYQQRQDTNDPRQNVHNSCGHAVPDTDLIRLGSEKKVHKLLPPSVSEAHRAPVTSKNISSWRAIL
jgi:hypothetical protein